MAFASSDILTGGWASTAASGKTALSTITKVLGWGIELHASTANTIPIYFAVSTAFAITTTDAASGRQLLPGQTAFVPLQDPSKLYLASTAAGAALTWHGA